MCLSVWIGSRLGVGELYSAPVPRSSTRASCGLTPSDAHSPEAAWKPSGTLIHTWQCSGATSVIPVACFPVRIRYSTRSSNGFLTQLFVLHEAMQIKQRSVTLPGPYPRPPATASCGGVEQSRRSGLRRANPTKMSPG